MEVYLLKSSACLILLFSFYKLFLEKENMHLFKRFYLLGIVLVSFGIPLLSFPSYMEASGLIKPDFISNTSELTASNNSFINDYLPSILWSIYAIGVLFFSIRFGKNLITILFRIKLNQKLRLNSFINVLLFDTVIPHTFFNYIFFNKQKFEAREIPEEVIVHEQTHAKQKHSIDIVFIELIQIVFWFNPIIYLIKYSIKLNHEFLADQAVLKKGTESRFYQNILLSFSSEAATPILANSINYSFIKKRFTVMKTHTSKRKIWIKSLIILPLLAVLIFGFSSREEIERDINNLKGLSQQKGATKEEIKEYNTLAKKYNSMSKDAMRINSKDISRIKYLYGKMTSKQKENAASFPNFPPPPPVSAPSHERAPKAIKKENGIDTDIPPPPLSPESKEYKLRKVKKQEKASKIKKDNLVHRTEDLDLKEEELKRVALLMKKKENRYKVRKLEQEKVSLERQGERNEIRLKRIKEREKAQDIRKVNMEERKRIQNKRLLETEKKKKQELDKQNIKIGAA